MDAPDSIRSFYKTLVALRKKMPVISAGKNRVLVPRQADLLAIAVRRKRNSGLCNCGTGIASPAVGGRSRMLVYPNAKLPF